MWFQSSWEGLHVPKRSSDFYESMNSTLQVLLWEMLRAQQYVWWEMKLLQNNCLFFAVMQFFFRKQEHRHLHLKPKQSNSRGMPKISN